MAAPSAPAARATDAARRSAAAASAVASASSRAVSARSTVGLGAREALAQVGDVPRLGGGALGLALQRLELGLERRHALAGGAELGGDLAVARLEVLVGGPDAGHLGGGLVAGLLGLAQRDARRLELDRRTRPARGR